jgi:hypothetical protein
MRVEVQRQARQDFCECGGSTNVEQDVNVLKLRSSRGEPTRLDPLLQVEGERVHFHLETTSDNFSPKAKPLAPP